MRQHSDPDLRTLKVLQDGDGGILFLLKSPDAPVDLGMIRPGAMTTRGPSAGEQVAGLCNLVNWRWQNPEEQPATILLDGETALRESSLGRPKP